MAKAIALLSGGLDSTLAILLVKKQGIDVTAITFLTHFGCDISDSSSCSRDPFPASEKFGFRVKLCHLADKFVDIVKNPKYGHGKNMNPCIDCRILMLKEAKELMRLTGADFVVTGEVLGQRPMSQRRETFPLIDREAGLSGYVLRPLSAKLLKPTVPETNGLVDRERLCDISGRTRKPQIRLAEEFGLTDYPNPAGGCLLTEPNFAWRLKELLRFNPEPSMKELNLLRVGRHFRMGPSIKIIAGRDEAENNRIEALCSNDDILLRAEGCGSPLVLVTGEGKPSEEDIKSAASICARYSDEKTAPKVRVSVQKNGSSFEVEAAPADEAFLELYRVQKRPEKPKRIKA